MSEEKIQKCLNVNLFFLVGNNFGSSEELSTIDYTEHGLMSSDVQMGKSN